jgi:hypothetical protein
MKLAISALNAEEKRTFGDSITGLMWCCNVIHGYLKVEAGSGRGG